MPVAAAAQVSMEVSPLRVDLKTKPGGKTTQAVTLVNHGKDAVRIRASVSDWYLSKDGTPQFGSDPTTATYSAGSWVRITPPEQIVQPGSNGVVRFTMEVPATIRDGGYRSSILFEFLPGGSDASGRGRDVVFKTRVATLVYVTIGTPKPAVELIDVQPLVKQGKPLSAVATLKNTGSVQVRTKGNLVVLDNAGTEVRRLALPDVPVLPQSERDVIVAISPPDEKQPLPPGNYRVEFRIDVGLPELLVGETTVTIGR